MDFTYLGECSTHITWPLSVVSGSDSCSAVSKHQAHIAFQKAEGQDNNMSVWMKILKVIQVQWLLKLYSKGHPYWRDKTMWVCAATLWSGNLMNNRNHFFSQPVKLAFRNPQGTCSISRKTLYRKANARVFQKAFFTQSS